MQPEIEEKNTKNDSFFLYLNMCDKNLGFQISRANNKRNMSLFVFVFFVYFSYFVLRLDLKICSTCVNQINKGKKYVILRLDILQEFMAKKKHELSN